MKFKLPANVTRALSRTGLQLKKHSPEIMVIAGVAGTVVTTVMACKATTKVNTILEEAKHDIEGIHKVLETPELNKKYEDKFGEKYTVEQSKKDLTAVYVQTGLKFVKLYGPAVAVGTASIISILAGHNLLKKRYIASVAAYAAVNSDFKDYRKRVVDRFGKELDKELRYNIKAKEVEEVVVNEDGTETVVKKTVDVINPNDVHSEFTFCFDELSDYYQKDAEYNKMFLLRQQAWFNEKLKTNGYVYMNEVLEGIGLPRTKAGQVVGWVYDEENPVGDNYIDFNMFDANDPNKREFMNGHERAIWIDLNVDGNILELMQ